MLARKLVSHFGRNEHDNLMTSGRDLVSYVGLSFPMEEDFHTFYWWAPLFLPRYYWNNRVEVEGLWKTDSICNLRARVAEYTSKWRNSVVRNDEAAVAKKKEIEQRCTAFNSAADLVRREYDEHVVFEVEFYNWKNIQFAVWEKASGEMSRILKESFTGGAAGIMEVIGVIEYMREPVSQVAAAESRKDITATAAADTLTVDN
jgi:hypothetical protein